MGPDITVGLKKLESSAIRCGRPLWSYGCQFWLITHYP